MIVNPEVIRERYNISDPIYSNGGGGNGSMIQAVHEFDDQYYSESDLSLFLQRNQLPNNTVSNVGFFFILFIFIIYLLLFILFIFI